MMDQQNFEAAPTGAAGPEVALAKALGQWPKANDKPAPAKPGSSARKAAAVTAPSVEILARELGGLDERKKSH